MTNTIQKRSETIKSQRAYVNMDNKSFDSDRIAEGYTKRPWLHKSVIDALKFDLDISDNYDVGVTF